MQAFSADRPIIENKYHLTNKPFNPYQRMAYHGYDYDAATGLDDDQIRAGLHQMEAELDALPHPIAKAKAIAYVLSHTRIDVNAHDWFVGFYSVNRLANCVCQSKWERAQSKRPFGYQKVNGRADCIEQCRHLARF